MDLKRHSNLFNKIAFAYKWFFAGQVKKYKRIIEANISLFKNAQANPLPHTVLDIGCGTGAFARSFELAGFSVQGVDIAHKMVEVARDRRVDCTLGDVTSGLPFGDDSFDYVVSAYVAHGLDYSLRENLFMEARRIARNLVIIHDYSSKRTLGTNFVEWLEGGDYFNFVEQGYAQMQSIFGNVEIIPVSRHANWYVCHL
jgi:SAM-dependent methyltransferase